MPFIRRRSPAKAKHVRGLLRAGAYVALVSVTIGAFQLRNAHADVKDRTVTLGRQMLQLANATQHDVNRLTINGQTMYVASSVSNDSADAVLARYQGDCQKSAAQPVGEWRELARAGESAKTASNWMPDGVMRGGDGREGTVVCFTKGESSKPSIREAFTSFAETGELGALGNLRYVYARTSDRGTTTVLTAWTDDKFSLAGLVPAEGVDAAGSDFAGLPRPQTANRVMSANVEGTPFGFNVYRSKQGPEKVVAFYDDEMGKRGWLAIDPELDKRPENAGDKTKAIGRLYEHNGVVLTLATNQQEGDTMTALGLAGVISSKGNIADTGVKASDVKPPSSKAEKNASALQAE